jgi:hypothetical protein
MRVFGNPADLVERRHKMGFHQRIGMTVVALLVLTSGAVAWAGAVSFWQVVVVDSAGDVGQYTSLAVLPSGRPAISYFDATNKDLKYACYDGSVWHTGAVDSAGDVGFYTSLAILPSGHPAISYSKYKYSTTDNDLKYAWFDGTNWQSEIVDHCGNTAFSRWFTSLKIVSGGPAITYFHDGPVKYARFDGSVWQKTMVDSVGSGDRWGEGTSLAVLPSGQPAISYAASWYDPYSPPYGDWSVVRYAWFDGAAWQKTTVQEWGAHLLFVSPSLAVLPSGQPAVSYHDRRGPYSLNYAWYNGTVWQVATVEQVVGLYSSLAILSSGQPAISYHDQANGDLKFAWLDGDTWHTTTVDSSGNVGLYPSLAVLPSGQPAISYYDATNGDLKCAVGFFCGDLNCDGQVNFGDINPFVLALTDLGAYEALYPGCPFDNRDINGDGQFNFGDINPFVALLVGPV